MNDTTAMVETAERTGTWAEAFARFDGDSRAPAGIRRAALDRFLELGFPTLRHEDWRFTSVARIADTPFVPATPDGAAVEPAAIAAETFEAAGWPRLVFINGVLDEGLSSPAGLPDGVTVAGLGELLRDDPQRVEAHLARYAGYDEHAFVALNTAFMADGAFIHVPDGVVLPAPLHVLFVNVPGPEPTVSHPRNLVVAGRDSQAAIVEQYLGLGDGVYFTNAVTEIVAGDNAKVEHYKLGRESASAYHVGTTRYHQGRDTTVTGHTITFGGALVRNDITAVLDGEGGHCGLDGLYVLSDRQHADNHLRVEHARPHCDSREYFKGVLDDRARAVFTGRIVVHQDAQKTDAKQTNMNLLLSDSAQVDTKPQLEIFADDVKCTHGATTGQLDADAIFYLRSRGLEEETARGVLIHAFAEESLEHVRPEPLRARIGELLAQRLPQGAPSRGAP